MLFWKYEEIWVSRFGNLYSMLCPTFVFILQLDFLSTFNTLNKIWSQISCVFFVWSKLLLNNYARNRTRNRNTQMNNVNLMSQQKHQMGWNLQVKCFVRYVTRIPSVYFPFWLRGKFKQTFYFYTFSETEFVFLRDLVLFEEVLFKYL